MKTLSPVRLLVAAALIGITAESAWSEEATPVDSSAPAGQAAAPGTGYVPGGNPPRPNQGGYVQPWQQPPQWPAPPPGYNQTPPYYPPYGQYQAAPAAPAENPLSTTLKETQEQLAKLQAKLETAIATLQKAHSDTINAGIQVDTSMTEVDTLKNILCELAARLETRKNMLQNAQQTTAAAPDDPDSAAAGEVDSETTEQAESQTDPQCSELTPSPAITSGQRAITVITE